MAKLSVWNKTLLEHELEHNKQLVQIVLEQFLVDMDLLSNQLFQCSASSGMNHHAIISAAHALKGAAAQARCDSLSAMCSQIERDFREDGHSAALPKAKLLIEVRRVEKLLKSYLDEEIN